MKGSAVSLCDIAESRGLGLYHLPDITRDVLYCYAKYTSHDHMTQPSCISSQWVSDQDVVCELL